MNTTAKKMKSFTEYLKDRKEKEELPDQKPDSFDNTAVDSHIANKVHIDRISNTGAKE